jgi:hypothetical protein
VRAPLLGEHTVALAHDLLGLDDARLDELKSARALFW